MSIATIFGSRLRMPSQQRALTDNEVQSWSALQLIEGEPDGGFSHIESSGLFHTRTFDLARELFAMRFPGFKVSPAICAWVALHSNGQPNMVTMWAAIVASVWERALPLTPGATFKKQTFKMQDLAAALGNKIPNDLHFGDVWTDSKLANGKYELDLERSWR